MKNFAGINFRESPILKDFAGINFRESTFSGVKKGIYFREFGRNSRNFLSAKISSLKVLNTAQNLPKSSFHQPKNCKISNIIISYAFFFSRTSITSVICLGIKILKNIKYDCRKILIKTTTKLMPYKKNSQCASL